MKLKDYLSSLTTLERRAFFLALDKHPNYISSLAAGALDANGRPRRPSPQLARDIEQHSGGCVLRWEVLPEVFDPPTRAKVKRVGKLISKANGGKPTAIRRRA